MNAMTEKPVRDPSCPVQNFDILPDEARLRQCHLVPNSRRPSGPTLLPFKAASLWRKVAEGTFPAPERYPGRVTAWRVGDLRAWFAAQAAVSEDRASFKAPSRKAQDRLQAAAAAHGYTLTQARNTDTAQVLLLLSKADSTRMFNTPAEVETFLAKLGSGVAV